MNADGVDRSRTGVPDLGIPVRTWRARVPARREGVAKSQAVEELSVAGLKVDGVDQVDLVDTVGGLLLGGSAAAQASLLAAASTPALRTNCRHSGDRLRHTYSAPGPRPTRCVAHRPICSLLFAIAGRA